jgi:hypothetical protein
VQDGVMFSTSSCLTSTDPPKGRFDIAVCDCLKKREYELN